ncbi:hypothetical protein GCM10023333_35140 [Ferrimonas pelagia]|uniref:Uncharacterized protein n=1 Tax=Ferrimonas pelagia TaxID=1177826 RepID=A0ABP9FCQ0_9GAMM
MSALGQEDRASKFEISNASKRQSDRRVNGNKRWIRERPLRLLAETKRCGSESIEDKEAT